MRRTVCTLGIMMAASVAMVTTNTAAQDYPTEPVRIVVPYSAGGGTDSVARSLANELSEKWNQSVIVDNVPGAGTSIGAAEVAGARADGYTLLFTDASSYAINPHIYDDLTYDPLEDLAPIALVTRLAPVLAISSNLPFESFEELLEYVRENPGELNYASPGVGSYTNVAMEYLKHSGDLDILHIPYQGTAGVIPDLLSGRIDMYMVTLSVFEAHEEEGNVRILATLNEEPLPIRPDLPTVGEFIPDYSISVWFGLGAPAGTPADILDKIHSDVMEILEDEEFRNMLAASAFIPGDLTREEYEEQVRRDHERWGHMVEASGATIE